MHKLCNLSKFLISKMSHPPQITIKEDLYHSFHLKISSKMSTQEFTCYLDKFLEEHSLKNKSNPLEETNAIWVELNQDNFGLVLPISQRGFKIHHGLDDTIVLYKWMANKKDLVPFYTTNVISCGAIVIHQGKILLVQERNGNRKDKFGIPGGRSDLGESISKCCERELFQQTGIKAKFSHILHFRELDNMIHNSVDTYFACVMQFQEKDLEQIQIDQRQIVEFRWVPLDEYFQFAKTNTSGTQLALAKYVSDLHKKGYNFSQKTHEFQRDILTTNGVDRNFIQYGLVSGNKIQCINDLL